MENEPAPVSIRQQLGQLEVDLVSNHVLQEDVARFAAENQTLRQKFLEVEDTLTEARKELDTVRKEQQAQTRVLWRWRVTTILLGIGALGILAGAIALFGERARQEGRIAEQQQAILSLQNTQSSTMQELSRAREQVGSASSEVGTLNTRIATLEQERNQERQQREALETEKKLILAERDALLAKQPGARKPSPGPHSAGSPPPVGVLGATTTPPR
ncbi:MAG: hypothetical protein QM758_26990 [Armatimonas sp.]